MEQNPLEEIRTEKSHVWLNMQPKRFKELISVSYKEMTRSIRVHTI